MIIKSFRRLRRDWFITRHYLFLSQSLQALLTSKTPLNLYLGVGPYPIHPMHLKIIKQYPGPWVLIDKYIRQFGTHQLDAAHLPFSPATVTVIYASHLLEHLPHPEVFAIVSHWYRILTPGGKLILAVPDLKFLCQEFIRLHQNQPPISPVYCRATSYRENIPSLLTAIYGSQIHPGEIHRSGFSYESLSQLLRSVGFKTVRIHSRFDAHAFKCLHAQATKG